MINKDLHKDVSATNATAESDNQPMTTAATKQRIRLLDNFSGFFTRRRQGRTGLYLPLVRVEGDN